VTLDPAGLPREVQRRLLLAGFDHLAAPRPRGPDLDRALAALAAGKKTTLSGLKLTGGDAWRLEKEAKPRR
jgi:tRNA(Ile)-lysidine synthase